jgi:hypothetical protein
MGERDLTAPRPRGRGPGRAAGWATLACAWLLAGAAFPGNDSDPADSCRVVGSAPADDLERAREGCARAAERFRLLYGVPAPAGTLEVSDSARFFSIARSAPDWHFVWPTTDRLREFLGERVPEGRTLAEEVETQWVGVLPHELGHVLLIAEADARRGGEPPRRLPDWLHEGTGVWMEPPTVRQEEYATLRAHRPFIPTLREITAFEAPRPADRAEGGSTVIQTFYPCASEEACGGRPHWSRIFSVTTRQFADGRVQVDTVFHERPPPPPSPVGSSFYAYSATLVRYLFDRGGPAAMDTLLTRIVREGDGRSRLEGLPGLPDQAGALEADWREWFSRWIFGD